MNLKELVEFLVKNIVQEEDMVSVKQLDDENLITIIVMVSKNDMGRVVGKNGQIAKAIRTIARASSYKNNLPKVVVEIETF